MLPTRSGDIAIPAKIVVDNTDLHYTPFDIKIKYLKDEPFSLKPSLVHLTNETFTEYAELTRRRPAPPRSEATEKLGLLDGEAKALRLCQISKNRDGITLSVQPAFYADYVRTHLLLDHAQDADGITLRKLLHSRRRLPAIGASESADILGVDILILTSDGYLVFQDRSSGVLTCPCTLGTSVSGTFAPEHLLGRDNVVDMISGGEHLKVDGSFIISNGEMFTETHLRQHDVTDIDFLGISRDLIRGGQPTMIFSAVTELDHNQIHDRYENALEKHETAALHFVSAEHILPDKRLSLSPHIFDEWVEWLYGDPLADASPVLLSSVGLLVKMLCTERAKAEGKAKLIQRSGAGR